MLQVIDAVRHVRQYDLFSLPYDVIRVYCLSDGHGLRRGLWCGWLYHVGVVLAIITAVLCGILYMDGSQQQLTVHSAV